MYKHGDADSRDLGSLSQSKPCFNFQQGNCRFGNSCRFSHGNATGNSGGGNSGNDRRGPRQGGPLANTGGGVIKSSLPDEGLIVNVENRVHVKLLHQKVKVFADLLERGEKNSKSWRCVDKHLDEIVAFGGTGLLSMILAIQATSQERPECLYVFFFEPNRSKQENMLKELKRIKQNNGPGGLYEHVLKGMKGHTPLSKLSIPKTKEQEKEDEEKKKADEQRKKEEETTPEALDKQLKELELKQKEGFVGNEARDAHDYDGFGAGSDASSDDDGDVDDMDDFM